MNYESIQIHEAPTPEELAAMRKQNDLPSGPRGGVSGNPCVGTQRVSQDASGNLVVEPFGGAVKADFKWSRPGMVTIPGIGETTREAAIAAGFLEEGASPNPKASPAVAGREQGEEIEKAETKDEETPAEIVAASAVLERAAHAVGGDAVNETLSTVAESGEIPTTLPEGFTAADAQAVWDGYHRQTEHQLSEVGASVAMLSEFLTPQQLAEARRAAVYLDSGRLHALGKEAKAALEALPDEDPEHFRELVQTLPAEYRDKVRKGPNGQWQIALPAPYHTISWGNAVGLGIVRL